MLLFSVRNLFYKDYKWTAYSKNDPHIFGKPDSTKFNREEGNEVVYLINKLMVLWNYQYSNTGNKIEKLIHDKLPLEIQNQEDAEGWLKENLKF